MGLEVTIEGQKYILIDVGIKEKKDAEQLDQAKKDYGLILQSLKYLHIDGGFWGSSAKILLVSVLIPEKHVIHLTTNVFK